MNKIFIYFEKNFKINKLFIYFEKKEFSDMFIFIFFFFIIVYDTKI